MGKLSITIFISLSVVIALVLIYFFYIRQSYEDKVENKFNIESKRMVNGSYDDDGNYYHGESHSIRPLVNYLYEAKTDLLVEFPEKIEVKNSSGEIVGHKKYRVQIVYFDNKTRKWSRQTEESKLLDSFKHTIKSGEIFTFVFYIFYKAVYGSNDKALAIGPEIYDKEISSVFSIKIV